MRLLPYSQLELQEKCLTQVLYTSADSSIVYARSGWHVLRVQALALGLEGHVLFAKKTDR